MQRWASVACVCVFSVWLSFVAGCGSSSSSDSKGRPGSPTNPLPPPYRGPAGAFQDRTPCPLPKTWPSDMTSLAAAFDSARGKVVFFPNDAGNTRFELWDWDGTAAKFSQRTPCTPPGNWPVSQGIQSAAFDPIRRVVVFHGRISRLSTNDIGTFEFDPATGALVDRSQLNPPYNLPDDHPLMFFDATIGTVVLLSTPNLWAWDASAGAWHTSSAAAAFPLRGTLYVEVYDPKRRKVYGFGSNEYGTVPGATAIAAELDLASGQWRSRTPATLPADWPELGNIHDGAYDEKRDRVVLFGNPSATPQVTWEWEPTAGSFHPIAADAEHPVPDAGQALYDAASGHVTAIAWRSDDDYWGDVWTWDGALWTHRRPNHIVQTWPDGDAPSDNVPLAVAYDSDRHRTVSFVRSRTNEAMGTTLEWDGTSWTDRTPADPVKSPPALFAHAMAYDAARRRTFLFGGVSSQGAEGRVWEWDGAAGIWTDRTPAPPPASWPSGQALATVSYDPTTRTILMFGGGSDTDTWSWNGASGTWTRRNPSAFDRPFSPDAAGLTFDDRLGKNVLIDEEFDALKAWVFDQAKSSWKEAPSGDAGAPPSLSRRSFSTAAYDQVRGTVLVAGGFAALAIRSYDPVAHQWADETPASVASAWPASVLANSPVAITYDVARSTLVVILRDGHVIERPSRP